MCPHMQGIVNLTTITADGTVTVLSPSGVDLPWRGPSSSAMKYGWVKSNPFGSNLKRELFFPWHQWRWEGAVWLTKWIPEAQTNSQYEIFPLAWKPLVLMERFACEGLNASHQLECTWFHKSAPAQQSPGMSLYMCFIFGCKIREPFNSSWFARIN